MHVSDGGGKYTFDGSHDKMADSKIKGLQYNYDYVQRKITVNFDTDVYAPEPGSNKQVKVGTGTGDTNRTKVQRTILKETK